MQLNLHSTVTETDDSTAVVYRGVRYPGVRTRQFSGHVEMLPGETAVITDDALGGSSAADEDDKAVLILITAGTRPSLR